MNNDYNFYLEKEVLSEFTAEILADFTRYFIRNDIDTDDKMNAMTLIFDELCELKNSIYSNKMQTIDDLKILEEKFLFAKSILKEVAWYINLAYISLKFKINAKNKYRSVNSVNAKEYIIMKW